MARHPLAWLLVAWAAFFREELFGGRWFSPADLLFGWLPWRAEAPPGHSRAANPVRSDEVLIGLPRRAQQAHDLLAHGFAGFQQHVMVGTPVTFAEHWAGYLYPFTWSFLVLPSGVANSILHLSIPLLAGLCMHPLTGLLSRRAPARAVGTIAWAFNGYLVVWLSSPTLSTTVAVLPLLVYLAARLLDQRRFWLGPAFALLAAWIFAQGYPPVQLIVVTIVAVLAAARLVAGPDRLRPCLRLAGWSALGLLAAALPLLVTADQVLHLATGGFRVDIVPLPPGDLQTWLFPWLYGNPAAGDWRAAAPQANASEWVAYIGSVTVVLALAGLAGGRRALLARPLVAGALGVGVLSLLLAYGVIRLDHLPILSGIRPARWQVGVDLAAALLAVAGLDLLLERADRRAMGAAWVLVAAAAAGVLVVHRHDLRWGDPFIAGDEVLRVALLIGVGAALVLLGVRPRLGGAALPALLAVELVTFGSSFNPSIAPDRFYPTTPALTYLGAHAAPDRALALTPGGGLWPGDVLNVYGIDSVTGYDHLRDDALVRFLGPNLSPGERDLWRRSGFLTLGTGADLSDPVWTLLDVRLVYVAGQELPPGSGGWREVYRGPDGVVLENPSPVGRVLVDRGAGAAPTGPGFARPDRVAVDAEGPGTLVLSVPYGPGWTATVGGRRVDPTAYRGYLLAVPLEAGGNRVEVAYAPALDRWGLVISLAGLAAILGLLGLGRLRSTSRPGR